MRKINVAIFTAITAVIFSLGLSVTAYAENDDDTLVWGTTTEVTEDEETTTTTSTTTESGISQEELDEKSEELQAQIDEIRRLFEENGYSIDGLSGNVQGMSGEISNLQMSLDELYAMITAMSNRMNSRENNNSGASPAPVQTTPIIRETEITTTVTTVHEEADTTPNGYLIEKAEKYPEERDFITVTTRDGHVFYVVIDYEDDNKRVYFLNTVDTADLKMLLEGTGTAAVSENTPVIQQTETKAVETNNSQTKKAAALPKNNGNMLLYIVGGVLIIVVLVVKKKSMGKKKQYDDDSDSDSNDDFTEEENIKMFTDEDEEE